MADETEFRKSLKGFMLQTVGVVDTSKRRLWSARDEVATLRRQLIEAEQRLEAAERDYAETRDLLAQNWQFFRDEYVRAFDEGSPIPADRDVAAVLGSNWEAASNAQEAPAPDPKVKSGR